jgi:hypothetical protein
MLTGLFSHLAHTQHTDGGRNRVLSLFLKTKERKGTAANLEQKLGELDD